MRAKKITAFFFTVLFIAVLMALTGCGNASRTNGTDLEAVNTNGNMLGNSANWGIAAIQEDWIYYQNPSDGNTLYKVKTDGSGKMKLDSEFAAYGINVVGDWVYYSDYGKIYKIRTDGKDKTVIYEGPPGSSYFVSVSDGWIYFNTEEADEYRLCRMRTDGTEITEIMDDGAVCVNVIGDWIYYNNFDDFLYLYRIRTDGTAKEKVGNILSTSFIIDGDWIYYSKNYLYKAKLDGTDEACLSGGEVGTQGINLDNGWIYFNSGNGGLYRIRTDGTDETRLTEETAYDVCIVGDWVYYTVLDNNLSVYRIKTDGTGREKVD